MNTWIIALALAAGLSGCAALEKDNAPKEPEVVEDVVAGQKTVYVATLKSQLDEHGLVVMGDSIGDSALFSCLARVAGGTDFDPAILFKDGKPIRHPDIKPGISRTPVSKDMVNGVLWCLFDLYRKGDTDHGLELVTAMINFGKAHKLKIGQELGWLYCTEEDRQAYKISDEDWIGSCFIPPSGVKDVYRIAKALGYPCDADCQLYSTVGANIPTNAKGYQRHNAVLTTFRNGLLEGGINDNSLKIVLENAAKEQPRNALYVAVYHVFSDGKQDEAYSALRNETLFPRDVLPTKANYCADYLFQRDDGTDDWIPCPESSKSDRGRGWEWVFAAAVSLGEVH